MRKNSCSILYYSTDVRNITLRQALQSIKMLHGPGPLRVKVKVCVYIAMCRIGHRKTQMCHHSPEVSSVVKFHCQRSINPRGGPGPLKVKVKVCACVWGYV